MRRNHMKRIGIYASWAFILLMVLFLIGPLAALGVYSFSTEWSGLLPGGFTLAYYGQLFANDQFWPSVFRGLIISVAPILLSGAMILAALYTAIFYCPRLEEVIQLICMVPHTLKGIILAISVLSLYAGSGPILGNRILMLICVYTIIILPYIYQGIRNNLRAVPIRQLVEAAELLGCGRMRAFACVVLPNILNGILVSALLGMSVIFGDFAVVKIIAGSRFITVQQLLYNARNQMGQYSGAIVMITFGITLIISAAALALQRREKRGRR